MLAATAKYCDFSLHSSRRMKLYVYTQELYEISSSHELLDSDFQLVLKTIIRLLIGSRGKETQQK